MPLRGGGEDGRVVVAGVRSLIGCGLCTRIDGGLSLVGVPGVLGRLVSPRFLGRFSRFRAALIGRLVDGGVLDLLVLRIRALSLVALNVSGVLGILSRFLRLRLDTGLTRVGIDSILSRAGVFGCLLLRGLVLRLIGPRLLSLVGIRGHLVGDLRLCIGLSGSLSRVGVLGILGRLLRPQFTIVRIDGGVLDVLVLRSQALSLGILGALGVLGGLFCVLLVADLARAGILSATLCLVTRVIGARLLSFAGCGLRIGLIGGLVLVHRRTAVCDRLGHLCRLSRLRLRRVLLTESRVHSGLTSRTISLSRSPRSPRGTRAVGSIGGRVVGQVAARTEIGKDLDVPGTGQPAEQFGIGGRVGRQRRPQVGAALCDGGLQGLVRSLSGNRRIGLMRRHHELNRIHAEPFRENVWVTSTDRARSQPILGPSPGSDHPRW